MLVSSVYVLINFNCLFCVLLFCYFVFRFKILPPGGVLSGFSGGAGNNGSSGGGGGSGASSSSNSNSSTSSGFQSGSGSSTSSQG